MLTSDNPEKSCTRPIWSVAGKSVAAGEVFGTPGEVFGTPGEVFGTPGRPHPLQQVFIEEQAGPRGYCLSGILVTARALLDRNPSPERAQIAQALDGNLCRYGTRNRIMRAIEKAAKRMQMNDDSAHSSNWPCRKPMP
jgi:nicotinate dehydrogenase subunit A